MREETAPDAIKPRHSVSELVALYVQSERDLRTAFALIAGAEKRLGLAFDGPGRAWIHVGGRHDRLNYEAPDDAIREVRRNVWRSLVEHLELRRFMSIKAWKELEQQLDRGEPPPVDTETVSGMASHYRSQMRSMLEEAVEEVFNWLRPPGSQFKRNSELEVPPRVILRWVVETGWGGSPFHVNYRYQPELSALENVFTALDGKGSVTKGHYSDLANAIAQSEDGTGATEYFSFRACKNRNLHLTFKRLDLLARLNQIAGGKRLRPGATP